MSSRATGNLPAVYIDLGTATMPEYAMYGGKDAVSYFFRTVQKSTWASFIQLPMMVTGDANFGKQCTVDIPRAPDYLLNAWFRVRIPSVELIDSMKGTYNLRWTRNLMHNLFKEIQFNIGDSNTTIQKINPEVLDFWTMHTVPAGKRMAYDQMIGNTDDLINPVLAGNTSGILPARTLTLPLPFFFSRDAGISMPCSNMNYTPLKLWFDIRSVEELLIVDDFTNHYSYPVNSQSYLKSTNNSLVNFEVWGEFAVVSGPERKNMGKYVRDMLIDQFQWTSKTAVSNSSATLQLTFAQSVRALFFGIKNVTNNADGSNYSAAQPVPLDNVTQGVLYNSPNAVDPISDVTLKYDSTDRLVNFPADFFALLMPYYHAPVCPREVGYHMYPYSLMLTAIDPMCSTNYSKLLNIFLAVNLSTEAQTGLAVTPQTLGSGVVDPDNAEQGQPFTQRYQLFCLAFNHIIIRIAGGTVSFPLA